MSLGSAGLAADLVGSVIFLILIAGAGYAIWGRKNEIRAVDDGPEDEPYRVYTRAFDLELAAAAVPAALPRASPDAEKGWYHHDNLLWRPACRAWTRYWPGRRAGTGRRSGSASLSAASPPAISSSPC